jgi:hypothetical protein
MGLFTKEEKVDYNVPLSLRMKATADKTQQRFTDTYLDPAIKENIGYESPRMKMKALTSGVDLTNGKKVQETFLALQAIDPQEAQGWLQSIKPVIAQHLDSIKIKDASLKSDILANKGNVNAHWTGLAMPQYIAAKTKELFEIHGVEGAGVPTLELFRSRLKDLGLEKADANRVYQDLAKALKAEEKDWKIRNQTRDFTGKAVVAEPDDNTSNEFDDPANNSDSITSNILGSSGTPGIRQIDPEASGFVRGAQGLNAAAQVRKRVNDLASSISPAIFGSLTLSVEEEKLNDRRKPAYAWFTSKGRDYFLKHPQQLVAASKGPLAWFEAKAAKMKKNSK